MQFRKLKRLAKELNVNIHEPFWSFGEWELQIDAPEGMSFNGQYTGTSFFLWDAQKDKSKGEVCDLAFEYIKSEAEEITKDNER